MTKTIIVRGDYLLAAAESVSFHNRTGFELRGESPLLDNQGSIAVSFNNASGTGLLGGDGGRVFNETGASFVMTGAGEYSVYGLNASVASFENQGFWQVTADADAGSAIGLYFQSNVDFLNSGVIEASGANAMAVHATFAGSYLNSGLISAYASSGDAQGMGIHSVSGESFSCSNTGIIEARGQPGSTGTYALAFAGHEGPVWEFYNSGVLRSNGYAFIQLQEANPPQHTIEVFHNSGKMIGLVDMGLGADQLLNTGAIRSDVDMGKDNDLYDGSAGKLVGALFGGGGSDTLIGGKGADAIHGDNAGAGAGADGADRIEGGRGNDSLWGDGGDDTIIGGHGGDLMWGGAGADTFVFGSKDSRAGSSVDHVGDLENIDVIDLSAIDADVTKSGNQAFKLAPHFDGHAGELMLTYEGTDQAYTTVAIDTDGDGVADASFALRLDGDHADFTNFVL